MLVPLTIFILACVVIAVFFGIRSASKVIRFLSFLAIATATAIFALLIFLAVSARLHD